MSGVSSVGGANSESQKALCFPYGVSKTGVLLSSSGSSTSESVGEGSVSSSSSISSPSSMDKVQGGNPICKNCLTSTTPLWRRDENGALLCNACGLFLKLHGRPRPISLKTDVIKSRNRKGTHHHSQQQAQSEPGEPKKAQSDDKKRKFPVQLAVKKQRIEDSTESRDMCSAANTLETLMSGDSSKPRIEPKGPAPTVPTQLPHLSALLGDVKHEASPAAIEQAAMGLETTPTTKPPSFEPKTQSYAHESIPVSTSSSTSSLVRGNSVPQRYNSPPRAQTPPVGSVQRVSALPVPMTISSMEAQEKVPLTTVLQKEEDVIKLKTRINELELVTDLYKRHIFELDERCKSLQCEIQSLKN